MVTGTELTGTELPHLKSIIILWKLISPQNKNQPESWSAKL